MPNELHDRLEALERKLNEVSALLELKKELHDGHKLTNGELRARHDFLKSALDGQIADAEAHGQRVSALEQDTMSWIASIDNA